MVQWLQSHRRNLYSSANSFHIKSSSHVDKLVHRQENHTGSSNNKVSLLLTLARA